MLNCYFLYNGEKKKNIVSYNGSGKANSLSFSLNVAYLLEKSERKFVIIVDFFGFRVLIECFTVSLANSDPLEVTEHHLVPDLYMLNR